MFATWSRALPLLSFRSRIVLAFAALFVAVQALTLVSIYRIAHDNAVRQLGQDLTYTERVVASVLTERGERMLSETRILVADFGFRTAVSDGDPQTLASALENLILRVGAQRACFVDLQGRTLADTAARLQDQPFAFPEALAQAQSHGKALAFGRLDGELFEWAIVPVLAPLPIGRVAVATAVGHDRVASLKALSAWPLDITLIERAPDTLQILIGTLSQPQAVELKGALDTARLPLLTLTKRTYIAHLLPLPSADSTHTIEAVLQIDFDQALQPYRPILYAVAALSATGLLLALLGSVAIAGKISQPLRRLAGASERLMNGQTEPLPIAGDDEFRRLAITFNRAAALAGQIGELQHKDRLRREMVAAVSHDLRTPLTALHGFLETMQLKADTLPLQERQQFLDIALRQSEKVGRLAQELFELAKLECDETCLSAEAFNLAELVQDILQKFHLHARQRGIALAAELDPQLAPVIADIALIERLLTNLLDNALRHTPPGGKVSVDAQALHGRMTVRVADTGIGIEPAYLATLFDWQSPLSRRVRSGAGGFGLVIVAKIVRLHGGDILVDSQVGHGTTFTFDLPLAGQ